MGLFDDLLENEAIFRDKEVLGPVYTRRRLPNRQEQITTVATILVTALRGETPSSVLVYGKTGTGKTACAKYVAEEFETTACRQGVSYRVEYVDYEVTDTQYRVLTRLANLFVDENETYVEGRIEELRDLRDRPVTDPDVLTDAEFGTVAAVEAEVRTLERDRETMETVPATEWRTDRVYETFVDAVAYREWMVVIVLDEIDKLVEKAGNETLYALSRMNADLKGAHVSRSRVSRTT